MVFAGLEGTYAVALTAPAIYSSSETRPTSCVDRCPLLLAKRKSWGPEPVLSTHVRTGSPPASVAAPISRDADAAAVCAATDTSTVASANVDIVRSIYVAWV